MNRLHLFVVCSLAVFYPMSGLAQLAKPMSTPARASLPRLLPGTSASVFASIHGNALNSTNGALPDSLVRLRDARYGRIVSTQTTDKAGLFDFGAIDPGTYVVELIGDD